MKADRLEFYRNKLRGTPVADLGRAMWAILLDATQEAEREEREACAKVCDEREKIERKKAEREKNLRGVTFTSAQYFEQNADQARLMAQDLRARGAA